MASTYVNNLRLNELGTGDGSGTWGTTTNTNLELIGEALGYGTEAITTNADTHTTTIAESNVPVYFKNMALPASDKPSAIVVV